MRSWMLWYADHTLRLIITTIFNGFLHDFQANAFYTTSKKKSFVNIELDLEITSLKDARKYDEQILRYLMCEITNLPSW